MPLPCHLSILQSGPQTNNLDGSLQGGQTNLGEDLRALGIAPAVTTKVCLDADQLGDIAGAVTRSVEQSLARLGLDGVAVIQLHNRIGEQRSPRSEIGSGAVLDLDDVLGRGGVAEAFRGLRARGLVQAFGVSAYGGDMTAVGAAVESGAFDVLSLSYSALNPTAWRGPAPQTSLRDYERIGARAAAAGLGVIALRVLEGGVLSGGALSPTARLTPERDELMRRAAELRMALDPFETVAETGLRYVLSNSQVSTALVGFSNLLQVEEALAAATMGALPEPMLTQIEARAAGPSGQRVANALGGNPR